jgi:hypothetical protein
MNGKVYPQTAGRVENGANSPTYIFRWCKAALCGNRVTWFVTFLWPMSLSCQTAQTLVESFQRPIRILIPSARKCISVNKRDSLDEVLWITNLFTESLLKHQLMQFTTFSLHATHAIPKRSYHTIPLFEDLCGKIKIPIKQTILHSLNH